MINPSKRLLNDHLIQRLNSSYNGTPWHGKSVMGIISMSTKPLPLRTLQLLNHMIAWRNFVTDALAGKAKKIELNTIEDWPPVTQSQEEILVAFEHSQSRLLHAIEHFNEEHWSKQPSGAPCSYYDLCHGVIDHDIYHSAQMALSIKH